MKTRILPALALIPLVAACAAPSQPRTASEEAPAAQAAAPAAEVQVASAAPARTPPVIATGELAAATPVSNVTTPPPAPPTAREVLGAPPPAAGEAEPEVEEVSAEPAPAGRLGTTVASLGSPTQGGLWLETALVDAPTAGRIEYNGQTVTLELRPSGGEPGSGSQISVEAMRALGAPLTSLPELTVYAG